MNIAIIGAGNVGLALAKQFAAANHKVTLGVRDPSSAKHTKAAGAARATVATIESAAAGAEVVIFATPWPATHDAVKAAGALKGKIVVDCTNPVKPDLSGLEIPPEGSAGQAFVQWLPGVKVVKCFNTTGAPNMANASGYISKPAMFLCGNDDLANEKIGTLAKQIGFEPIDVGGINFASSLEHIAMAWIQLALAKKTGTDFAFAVVRR